MLVTVEQWSCPVDGGYSVSDGRTVELSGRRRLCGVYICTLRDTATVSRNQWGERIQNFKVGNKYETAECTWGQSDWL